MLCAPASPVKYEGKRAEHERHTQAGQPDTKKLGQPVFLGRNPEVMAANEIDLRRQKRARERQAGQGTENAGAAL
jgi:hypothetical protein